MARTVARRVVPAFDLAVVTNRVGAPSFAQFAKGGNHERVRNGPCLGGQECVGITAARPCKRRKDGAPTLGRILQFSVPFQRHRECIQR